MDKYINTFGLYSFFTNDEEHYNYVHPQDLNLVKNLFPYGKVFYCFATIEDYIYLSFGNVKLRVKPYLYKEIKSDGYFIGDTLEVFNDSAKGIKAIINEMNWHYKNEKIMYQLKIDGKVKSRRYWQEDFKRLD